MKGGRSAFSRPSERRRNGSVKGRVRSVGGGRAVRAGGAVKKMGRVCRSEGCIRAGDGQHPLI